MTLQQEFNSWFAPKPTGMTVAATTPNVGSQAPRTDLLPIPLRDDSETSKTTQAGLVIFLRHCGCPFAEKTFLNAREIAKRNRERAFFVVSQSDHATTQSWLDSLPQAGSEPRNLHFVYDPELTVYAAWGLGTTSFGHVLGPTSLYQVFQLGINEGIWNRPTVSGSRWQKSGAFGLDDKGVVQWGQAAERADAIPDFEDAIRYLS